jgi:hypothetical protein
LRLRDGFLSQASFQSQVERLLRAGSQQRHHQH